MIRSSDGRLQMTYVDLVRCTPKDSWGYEIYEGELIVADSPEVRHQRIVSRLNDLLKAGIERQGLGEVLFAPLDVILDETTVFQPDLLAVHHSRHKIIGEAAVWGAPDLVVEVASKTSEKHDRVRKLPLYLRFGVGEVWLVDPESRSITAVTGTPDQPRERRFAVGDAVSCERFGLHLSVAAVFVTG
jgi:Uma2 family endonuclease